ISDERWGEASAIVVGTAGIDATALLEAARAAVAEAVGPQARPRQLEVVSPLPMLSSGKPDRRALRALFAQ
ncbi:MAG TPA: acyl-CoA synthetase, partial [Microbacteriaceae bacterium]|nr:acyl-CoA synthetase [Microbacteriaceae bacterium]